MWGDKTEPEEPGVTGLPAAQLSLAGHVRGKGKQAGGNTSYVWLLGI